MVSKNINKTTEARNDNQRIGIQITNGRHLILSTTSDTSDSTTTSNYTNYTASTNSSTITSNDSKNVKSTDHEEQVQKVGLKASKLQTYQQIQHHIKR